MTSTTFIYGLCDPDTLEVRYVGKSNNVKYRFWRHLHDKSKVHKANWIRLLQAQGKQPILKIIEEVPTSAWEDCERRWIAYYRSATEDITDGGDGGAKKGIGLGHPVSPETREKIRLANLGRKHTAEELQKMKEAWKNKDPEDEARRIVAVKEATKIRVFTAEGRKRISESRKGVNNHPNHKNSIESNIRRSQALKGRVVTEETKNKLRGRIINTETRERMSKAKKGKPGHKLSEEVKNKLSIIKKGNQYGLGYKHTEDAKRKIARYHVGKPLSLEIRQKISEARKRYFQNKRVHDTNYKCDYTCVSGSPVLNTAPAGLP